MAGTETPTSTNVASPKSGVAALAITFGLALAVLSGCSTSKVYLAGEVSSRPGEKYVEVVRPATLVGVVVAPDEILAYDTLNGRLYPRATSLTVPDIITFDSSGGNIDVDNQTVTGTSQTGSLFTQSFGDLLYLQVKEVDLAKKFITPMELTCDREAISTNPRKRIGHGSSPCWDVIEFNGAGGRYDSTTRAIVGVTKRGTAVSISTADILQARTSWRSNWKTARVATVLGGLFLCVNGALHFWDAY